MGSMICNKIGLAGEFRVMSELLLRGHNPAKSYLEEGADIVLENGKRVEVKSGHKCHSSHRATDRGKGYRERGIYSFTLKGGGRRQQQNLVHCDFIILWCIDDDCFFILPMATVNVGAISIANTSGDNKWMAYKNRWDLLKRAEERR